MAQTTTAINACDAAIWLDDESGTPVDISGSSSTFNLDLTQDTAQVPTFQSDWKIVLSCGRGATASLDVVYTTTADEAIDLLKDWFFNYKNTKRTLSLYVPDKNVGSDHYYGEFLLAGLSIPVSGGAPDPIVVSASLELSGALTWTVAAT